MTTKKASAKKRVETSGPRAEYRFDYARSRRNRFAARMTKGVVAVVLDPDVASAFPTSTAVNAALRSMIGNGSVRPRP
jgi:uncharacterized protein (DUF4415 family)